MIGWLNIIPGFIAGVITGFGIGGGTLLMVYLTAFAGFPQLAAQGINLIYFLSTASASLVTHIKNKLVDKKAAVFSGVTGIVFAIAAAFAAQMVNVNLLRKIFGVFLVIIGIIELFVKKK